MWIFVATATCPTKPWHSRMLAVFAPNMGAATVAFTAPIALSFDCNLVLVPTDDTDKRKTFRAISGQDIDKRPSLDPGRIHEDLYVVVAPA